MQRTEFDPSKGFVAARSLKFRGHEFARGDAFPGKVGAILTVSELRRMWHQHAIESGELPAMRDEAPIVEEDAGPVAEAAVTEDADADPEAEADADEEG